jgi:hypothetical protein
MTIYRKGNAGGIFTLAIVAVIGFVLFRGCAADNARNAAEGEKRQEAMIASASAVEAVKGYYQLGAVDAGSWGRWSIVSIKLKESIIFESTVVDVILDIPDDQAREIMSRSSGARATAVRNACPSPSIKVPLSLPQGFSVEIQPRYAGTIFDDVSCLN